MQIHMHTLHSVQNVKCRLYVHVYVCVNHGTCIRMYNIDYIYTVYIASLAG